VSGLSAVTLRSRSVDETRAIGAALAPLLRPRDLLVLAGDMGAGKTAFTQGVAAGLGITTAVTSPTFTLVHTYPGRTPLHHVDVYRLERLAELHDLGLAELLDGDAVVVVEWGDAVAAALPADRLEVTLAFGAEGDDDRRLTITSLGRSWSGRERALAEALGGWRC